MIELHLHEGTTEFGGLQIQFTQLWRGKWRICIWENHSSQTLCDVEIQGEKTAREWANKWVYNITRGSIADERDAALAIIDAEIEAIRATNANPRAPVVEALTQRVESLRAVRDKIAARGKDGAK